MLRISSNPSETLVAPRVALRTYAAVRYWTPFMRPSVEGLAIDESGHTRSKGYLSEGHSVRRSTIPAAVCVEGGGTLVAPVGGPPARGE